MLDETTEVLDVVACAVLPAYGPEEIGFERRREPKDPTQKLKLPIIRSISCQALQRPELGWVGVVENLQCQR
jgi:hypothetical protein